LFVAIGHFTFPAAARRLGRDCISAVGSCPDPSDFLNSGKRKMMAKTMVYSRPDITILGEATDVIQNNPSIKGPFTASEGPFPWCSDPAYDLDE